MGGIKEKKTIHDVYTFLLHFLFKKLKNCLKRRSMKKRNTFRFVAIQYDFKIQMK